MTYLCPECQHPLIYDVEKRVFRCPQCGRYFDENTALKTGVCYIRCLDVLKFPDMLKALRYGHQYKKLLSISKSTLERIAKPMFRTMGLLVDDRLTKFGKRVMNAQDPQTIAKLLLPAVEAVESQRSLLKCSEKSWKELHLMKEQCIRIIKSS